MFFSVICTSEIQIKIFKGYFIILLRVNPNIKKILRLDWTLIIVWF